MVEQNNDVNNHALSQPIIKENSTPWLVWLLPLIALIIGGWLTYKYYTERGTEIIMHFPYGSEIKPGETELRFEGIKLGQVTSTTIAEDLTGIDATVLIEKKATVLLQKDTLFWLVKPEVTISRVTGLETLVSGTYITLQLGESIATLTKSELLKLKPRQFEYKALAEPPLRADYMSGVQFKIISEHPASISVGAPLTYNKLKIGEVEAVELVDDSQLIRYYVYVEERYKNLIHNDSRFWNTSGFKLKGSLNNLELNVDSLTSLLIGGISLYNPQDKISLAPLDRDHAFHLYENRQSALNEGSSITVRFQIGSEIVEGMPLKYQGIQVGEVESYRLDKTMKFIDAEIQLYDYDDKIAKQGAKFWLVEAQLSLTDTHDLDTLIGGKYIAVELGSGKAHHEFKALSSPPNPVLANSMPLSLESHHATAIAEGAPVTFNKIQIGQVAKVTLSDSGDKTRFTIYIQNKFKHLINADTLFWDASGVNLKASLSGVEIDVDSLKSIMLGGIAAGNPKQAVTTKPQDKKQVFKLHKNEDEAYSELGYISVRFDSATDIHEGMPLKYNGIKIGEVEKLQFSQDMQTISARILIDEYVDKVARVGAQFWVVKPEIGIAQTRHIETLISGNYINMKLGTGKLHYDFVASNDSPILTETKGSPLNIVLVSDKLGSVKQGVNIYYKDIPVGKVDGAELSSDARYVNIYASIEDKYATLVRDNSQFWNMSGLDIEFGLLSGLEVDTNSVESILEGGIAFATPDKVGKPVKSGKHFMMADKPEDEWMSWRPTIRLGK